MFTRLCRPALVIMAVMVAAVLIVPEARAAWELDMPVGKSVLADEIRGIHHLFLIICTIATIGVFGFAWLAIRAGVCDLPANVNLGQLYGVAILCGVGFTMNLFIGSLAFEEGGAGYGRPDRLGIIFGSLVSGIFGWLVVRVSTRRVGPKQS